MAFTLTVRLMLKTGPTITAQIPAHPTTPIVEFAALCASAFAGNPALNLVHQGKVLFKHSTPPPPTATLESQGVDGTHFIVAVASSLPAPPPGHLLSVTPAGLAAATAAFHNAGRPCTPQECVHPNFPPAPLPLSLSLRASPPPPPFTHP